MCVAGWVFGKARFGAEAVELFCEEESPFLVKYDADTGGLISAGLTTPHMFGTGRLRANLPDGGSLRAGRFWISQAFSGDGNGIVLHSAGDDDMFIAAWRGDGSLA